MATTMAWGEEIQVIMELGFPVNPFTLDDAGLGVLDSNALDGSLVGDDVAVPEVVGSHSRVGRDRPAGESVVLALAHPHQHCEPSSV